MIALAEQFARALDREDYDEAARLLAPDCEYLSPKETLVSTQAIVASYREAGDWVKANIDAVAYESSVRSEGSDAVVTFVDRLTHAGQSHTYACEQVLSFASDGAIRRIVHRELPGQREAVDAFLGRAGVAHR
jgi:limonene-1,2-epoxide hydrolase